MHSPDFIAGLIEGIAIGAAGTAAFISVLVLVATLYGKYKIDIWTLWNRSNDQPK